MIVYALAALAISVQSHDVGPGQWKPNVFGQDSPGRIVTGWHDELDDASLWRPLNTENKARMIAYPPGVIMLWLDHVPEGWPYTYQWSGESRDAKVEIARYPVLMAHVDDVRGYAHMDIDVLDANGKAVKTLRSSTLSKPGVSTIDLSKSLDPATYNLRLRLIVGGSNDGCSAMFDWVRFGSKADAPFLSAHPEFRNVVGPPQRTLNR